MRYLIAILVLSLGRLVDAQPRAQPAAPAFENTPRQFSDEKVIEPWAEFISVDGQAEPIPQAWLTDDEARIAHSLKLPEAVPKTVPYDFPFFGVSGGRKGLPRGAVSYFDHLCKTEAGTWIFRTVDNVEGLYVARPQSDWTAMEAILHTYGVENPWIQRTFALREDSARWQGGWLIGPPLYNFHFVEEPRRNASWQATITEPYIRLFEYDGLGRRIRKTVSGAQTQYVYDGANAVQELNASNAVTANVVGGLGMDAWYFRTEGAATRHFLTDALNSTRALADDAKAIQTRYQYEPYGETTSTGVVSANSSQYTGRENDGTGLYYYRARYYHPGIKRFVSEDPIGLRGGANHYSYVGGRPTMLVDPEGELACFAPLIPLLVRLLPPLVATANAVVNLSNVSGKPNTPDQQALGDIINDATNRGTKPLSGGDADTVLDWARELGIPRARDDRDKTHWERPHIHVPGIGAPTHIPADRN